MSTTIDACGRSCPEPVLMTKAALQSGDAGYEVLVDNQTALQNVTRFATQAGYAVASSQKGGVFTLRLTKK